MLMHGLTSVFSYSNFSESIFSCDYYKIHNTLYLTIRLFIFLIINILITGFPHHCKTFTKHKNLSKSVEHHVALKIATKHWVYSKRISPGALKLMRNSIKQRLSVVFLQTCKNKTQTLHFCCLISSRWPAQTSKTVCSLRYFIRMFIWLIAYLWKHK